MRQPDGKLIAAGTSGTVGAVVRFEPDGSLDAHFGKGGEVTTANTIGPSPSAFYEVLLRQPDGKLIAAGEMNPGEAADQDIALVRYGTDGSLDRSFGHGGKTRIAAGPSLNNIHALVRQPDGKLVIAVSHIDESSDTSFSLLVRLSRNGRIDPGFGRK